MLNGPCIPPVSCESSPGLILFKDSDAGPGEHDQSRASFLVWAFEDYYKNQEVHRRCKPATDGGHAGSYSIVRAGWWVGVQAS